MFRLLTSSYIVSVYMLGLSLVSKYFNKMLCLVLDAYEEEDYAKRLKSMIHLAELCVELLKQNDEHYADVRSVSFNSV